MIQLSMKQIYNAMVDQLYCRYITVTVALNIFYSDEIDWAWH